MKKELSVAEMMEACGDDLFAMDNVIMYFKFHGSIFDQAEAQRYQSRKLREMAGWRQELYLRMHQQKAA